MRINFATWLYEPSQAEALTNCSAKHRLISFYHTKEHSDKIEHYVQTGLVLKDEKKAKKSKKIK